MSLRTRREDRQTIRRVAEEVLPVAVHTGDRAYQFVHLNAGFHEVRVWPNGDVVVTPVDAAGNHPPAPLPKLRV